MLTTTLGSLQTISISDRHDLTGLKIRSDMPVWVSFGLEGTRMPSGFGYDHMWLQLPSSDLWGKEYVNYPFLAFMLLYVHGGGMTY